MLALEALALHDAPGVITDRAAPHARAFSGFEYQGRISEQDGRRIWSDVRARDPRVRVVSRFFQAGVDVESLTVSSLGDGSFLYLHSEDRHHIFFVATRGTAYFSRASLAIFWFHSPSAELPLWHADNLVGDKMGWTEFLFENYGPFTYKWTDSFVRAQAAIVCDSSGAASAVRRAIARWQSAGRRLPSALPQAVLVFFKNAVDNASESAPSRNTSRSRGCSSQADAGRPALECVDEAVAYLDRLEFEAYDSNGVQATMSDVRVLKRGHRLVDEDFLGTTTALFGVDARGQGFVRVPFGIDLAGSADRLCAGLTLGALPATQCKTTKCMFISTERFFDMLAGRGGRGTLPKTCHECTHVAETWNIEGPEAKDEYNFHVNWFSCEIAREVPRAELLQISKEDHADFQRRVAREMRGMEETGIEEGASVEDVTVEESVQLRRNPGSTRVVFSKSFSTGDLFPSADRDIAVVIPVYLSICARVGLCDICQHLAADKLHVCDAGHAMCSACMHAWMQTFQAHTRPTCPFCRRAMTSAPCSVRQKAACKARP